jgi:hypothetical protein
VIRNHQALNASEKVILDEVAAVIDTIDELPATAIVEKRQQRTLLGKLLGQLALPDEDGNPEVDSPIALRGRRAAQVKHDRANGRTP